MKSDEVMITLPPKLYEQIEEDVSKLHIDLELSIPINPIDIAHRLGFIVKYYSEIVNNDEDFNLLSKDKNGNQRDGLSYYDSSTKKYIICVNDIDSNTEEHDNFTIMHEIGHIRMGHKEDSPLAEKIANYYAAYSLVPSPLPRLYSCSSIIDIINIFGVSVTCGEICFNRWIKWQLFSGEIKPYEKKLMAYYKKIRGGTCLW